MQNNAPLKIDLHSHTHYSDGKLSVRELLLRATQMQVDVLAITDHDSVGAISPALDLLEQDDAFKNSSLRLISGCEISCSWHGFEIHILGLDVDHRCPVLLDRLNSQLQRRIERAQRISEKLSKCGIDDMFTQVKELMVSDQNQTACMSRAHFANILVERGVCTNFDQAFRQYLGKNKRAYVKPQWVDIASAVEWIQQAGGKAVIAHPFRYDMTTKWLRRLCSEFKAVGGDGMEVQHPNLDVKRHKLMLEIAKELGLCASAGSDFHAPSRWTELGRRLNLPDDVTPIWQTFDRTQLS